MPTLVSNNTVYKIKTDNLVSVLINDLESAEGTISYDIKSAVIDSTRKMQGVNIYVQNQTDESANNLVDEVISESHWLYEIEEIEALLGFELSKKVTKIIWHWSEENNERVEYAEVHTENIEK